MTAIAWFLVAGIFLVGIALFETLLERLPLTMATLYLALGAVLGPLGLGLVALDAFDDAAFLERATEVAVIVSLFSAGLKLRLPFRDRRWLMPVRLAFGSMAITVLLVSLVGVYGLGLPVGAAVLLGAVLAPTDPVLASAVQVSTPTDRDRLRFTLTGEAGLNDGTAFPFVMLGLGLLGLHELGPMGWRWLAVDVVWAVAGGLAIGAAFGTAVARLVVFLRQRYRQAVGTDDFLALGVIALSYGVALLLHTYGFLAVFAAGLALGRIDREVVDAAGPGPAAMKPAPEDEQAVARVTATAEGAAAASAGEGDASPQELATGARTAHVFLAQAVLGFSEQLERIGEVAVVVVVGSMLTRSTLAPEAIWFVPLLFLVIRPASVLLGSLGRSVRPIQRTLLSWFGVRGIGSLYYLSYAITHGVPETVADRLVALTLTVVAASVVVHGVSVTPLMRRYEERVGDTG